MIINLAVAATTTVLLLIPTLASIPPRNAAQQWEEGERDGLSDYGNSPEFWEGNPSPLSLEDDDPLWMAMHSGKFQGDIDGVDQAHMKALASGGGGSFQF